MLATIRKGTKNNPNTNPSLDHIWSIAYNSGQPSSQEAVAGFHPVG